MVHRDGDAVLDEKVFHRRDVRQIGDILKCERLRCQQARSHQRQCCVLGTANRDDALERHATLDPDFVHRPDSTPARRRGGRDGPPVRPGACFYWKGERRSSWRLALPIRRLGLRNCQPVPRSLLFLTPEQVVAQRLSQPFVAGHPLGVLTWCGALELAHRLRCSDSAAKLSRGHPRRNPDFRAGHNAGDEFHRGRSPCQPLQPRVLPSSRADGPSPYRSAAVAQW